MKKTDTPYTCIYEKLLCVLTIDFYSDRSIICL